jgi:F420-0:gamma-glutamyl ligase
LGVEEEENKAVLVVVSDRRGEVCSAGAMVRTVVAVGFSLLRLFTGKRERGGR